MAYLYSHYRIVTFKIRSKSLKSKQLFFALPTMYIYKFGENPSPGLENNARKRLIYTVFIGWWSWN